MRGIAISLFLLAPIVSVSAQNWEPLDTVNFIENGQTLSSPFAGGLDLPQFSLIHLDADTIPDLIVFDRAGELVLPFLNNGSSSNPIFTYSPQYKSAFPAVSDWMLARDFNCDGKEDLFVGDSNGISVFRNTSAAGNLSFVLEKQKLTSSLGGSPNNIFVLGSDIPCIRDADNDGDLDILTFDPVGSYVVFHRNDAFPSGSCDSLVFEVADPCWGKFMEAGLNNSISLNISCKGNLSSHGGVHSGSTVEGFDIDGDNDLELVIGDLVSPNLVFVRNGGSTASALMDTADYLFPFYNVPVHQDQFVAGYVFDADNDGKEDFVSAPNAGNVSINFHNSWLYKDVGSGMLKEFSRITTSFLADEMVDCGSVAKPAFSDVTGDGLVDLVIGNRSYKDSAVSYAGLTVYENTGTAAHAEFTLVSRDFQNISALFSPSIFGICPAFGDLDNDGDLDLLLGDSNGKLHYLTNTAGAGNPSSFSLTTVNYFSIDVGQYAAPFIVDLDRDGLKDLVVGEMGGTLNFYKNSGTSASPSFPSSPTSDSIGNIDTDPICCTGFSSPFFFEEAGAMRLVVGAEDGKARLYGNIDGNVLGTYTLLDGDFMNLNEGKWVTPAAANLDSDSNLEWVVGTLRGGISLWNTDMVIARDLSVQEKIRFKVVPNPTTMPTIICERNGIYEVKISDALGRDLFENRIEGRYLEINSDVFQSGIYFIRITDQNQNSGTAIWIRP